MADARHTVYATYCYDRSNPSVAVWNPRSLNTPTTTFILRRAVKVTLGPVLLLVVGLHALVNLDSRLVPDQRFRRHTSLHIYIQ